MVFDAAVHTDVVVVKLLNGNNTGQLVSFLPVLTHDQTSDDICKALIVFVLEVEQWIHVLVLGRHLSLVLEEIIRVIV